MFTSVQPYQEQGITRMGILPTTGRKGSVYRQPVEPRLDKGASQEGHRGRDEGMWWPKEVQITEVGDKEACVREWDM